MEKARSGEKASTPASGTASGRSSVPAVKNLRAAAAKAISERMAQGLSAYRTPQEKFEENPKSRAMAVNAKCYDCVGDDSGWKWGIGNCESTECPLHSFRPYQFKLGAPAEGMYRD